MIYTASRLSTQCADNLGTVKTWLHILIYYFNESDSSSLIFNKTNLNLLLNVLYHIVMEMKIRESSLQTGTFIYKPGISVTKQDFHLQMGSLGLQMGFSVYYLPKHNNLFHITLYIYYFLYYILYILFDISYNAYRKEVI